MEEETRRGIDTVSLAGRKENMKGKRISYLWLKIGIRGRILVSIFTFVLVAHVSVIVLDTTVSRIPAPIFLCNRGKSKI